MPDWVVETVPPRPAPDWRARLLWWLGGWAQRQALRWGDHPAEFLVKRDRVTLFHARAERDQWERRMKA